jgi:hypothetical protein
LAIFSTKTWHIFAVVIATSIKVGSWCGDITVWAWNRVHKANFHLI